jgi:hypothetical protein
MKNLPALIVSYLVTLLFHIFGGKSRRANFDEFWFHPETFFLHKPRRLFQANFASGSTLPGHTKRNKSNRFFTNFLPGKF